MAEDKTLNKILSKIEKIDTKVDNLGTKAGNLENNLKNLDEKFDNRVIQVDQRFDKLNYKLDDMDKTLKATFIQTGHLKEFEETTTTKLNNIQYDISYLLTKEAEKLKKD